MDFGKKQLLKYGWTEGKGLGRNEDGIASPIKPKLKFDTTGLGKDKSEQFTHHWWEHAYNSAANNLEISKDQKGKIKLKSKEEFNITTSKYIRKKHAEKSMEYGSFIKKSTLHGQKIQEESSDDESIKVIELPKISDEDLFKFCEGRTAHKSARHGHKLNGKLSRIEEQEKLMLEKLLKSKQENSMIEEPKKKLNREQISENLETNNVIDDTSNIKKKKKKKKIMKQLTLEW